MPDPETGVKFQELAGRKYFGDGGQNTGHIPAIANARTADERVAPLPLHNSAML
jgi:hypothetical protein